MKRFIIWVLVAGFVIFLGSAAYTFQLIHKQVSGITTLARSEYPGDALEALCSLVRSEDFGFEDKNSAIWALGQLADPEALPFLEQLNALTAEDAVPFDRSGGLSKYEIERAIKWCKNGNLTSWMYKKINQ